MLLVLFVGFIAPMLAWVRWGNPLDGLPRQAFELRLLLWTVLLSLLLPVLQVGRGIRRRGGAAVRGNRDWQPRPDGVLGRVSRAHANMVESLVPFVAAVLTAHAIGVSNRWTVAASTLYLAARVTHAVTYAMGITIVRSSAFYAGWIATATIAVAALNG